MPEESQTVLIALGSNLGDSVRTLVWARRALEEAVGAPGRASRLYRTPPVYDTEQPPFVNAVLRFETTMSVRCVMSLLQQLEAEAGRERTRAKGPRTLDLDLLAHGASCVSEEDLQVPHPRLHERAFVLVPLRDVAPTWQHPTRGEDIDAMWAGVLDDPASIEPMEHPAWSVTGRFEAS